MMKKGYLVIGLIFFLSNIFVFDLVHLFHINAIKKEAQANLKVKDSSEACVFVVGDLSEINWIESRNEFEKEGMLYDVYGIVQVSDGYKIYARSDGKETHANERWLAFKNRQQETPSEQSPTWSLLLNVFFLKSEFQFQLSFLDQKPNYGISCAKSLVTAHIPSIPIPPPEFC